MTDTLQFRRGTTAKTDAFTGAIGEITVDTDKQVAVVHDGSTQGGFPLLRDDLSNLAPGAAAALAVGSATRVALAVTQAGHGFITGTPVYHTASGWAKAQANAPATAAVGVAEVTDANAFTVVFSGTISGLSGGTAGQVRYLDPTTAGALTASEPTAAGQYSQPLLQFTSATEAVVLPYRAVSATVLQGTGGTGSSATSSAAVDYALLTMTGDLSSNIAAGNTVPFNTLNSGNLTADTTTNYRVTLKAGRTYLLTTGIRVNGFTNSSGYIFYNWYNFTAGANIGTAACVLSATYSGNSGSQEQAVAVITPAVDTDVGVRLASVAGLTQYNGSSCYAMVQQIGGPQTVNRVSTVVTQTGHGFTTGTPVYWNGTAWVKALANAAATAAAAVVEVIDTNSFNAVVNGPISGLTGGTAGTYAYLDPFNVGTLTTTAPTGSGLYVQPILQYTSATTATVAVRTAQSTNVPNLTGTMRVLVQEYVVPSNTTSFTLTGLNGDSDLEYEIEATFLGANGQCWYTARFNGDATAANYKTQAFYNTNTTATAASISTQTGINIGYVAATGQTALGSLKLMAKSGTVRLGRAFTTNAASTGTTPSFGENFFSWIDTASNLTSITVSTENNAGGTIANGIGAGSRVAIYARKAVGAATQSVSANFRGALLTRSGSQTINTSTWTSINWGSSQYDTDGFWSSGNPTRLTVPAGVNKVRISAQVFLSNSGTNFISVIKNGSTFVGGTDEQGSVSDARAGTTVTAVVPVVPGDYFEVRVYTTVANSTASTANVNWAGIEVLDPVPVAISGFGNNTTSDYAFLTLAAQQTTGITANAAIKFTTATGNLTLDSSTGRVTLKAGKTYELTASTRSTGSSSSDYLNFAWYNVTANAEVGVRGQTLATTLGTGNENAQPTAVAVVTPMVDSVFELRIMSVSGTVTALSQNLTYGVVKQIGGPANGLNYGPAGYAMVVKSGTTNTTIAAVGSAFAFDTIAGNLTLSGGGVVLKAGRTYLLQAGMYLNNGGAVSNDYFNYQFHDGSAYIGSTGQALSVSYNSVSGGNSTATAIYRPTTDVTVTLRTTATSNASNVYYPPYCYMMAIELASAVDTYSTNETLTDKLWIDGKPIYRKVVSVAPLPAASVIKTVAHGLTGMTQVIDYRGFAYRPSDGARVVIPYANGGTGQNLAVYVDNTNITISAGTTDWSAYTTAYLTIEYIK